MSASVGVFSLKLDSSNFYNNIWFNMKSIKLKCDQKFIYVVIKSQIYIKVFVIKYSIDIKSTNFNQFSSQFYKMWPNYILKSTHSRNKVIE